MRRTRLFTLCCVGLFFAPTIPVFGSSLDFGWGQPVEVKTRPQTRYLVWPIQISNPGPGRLTPNLEIVAVTDTGKQYHPTETAKVSFPAGGGDVASVAALQTHIFPSVTRRAAVVFERFDPRANVVHFYVGGLTQAGSNRSSPYLHVTYTRSGAGWTWRGTSVLE